MSRPLLSRLGFGRKTDYDAAFEHEYGILPGEWRGAYGDVTPKLIRKIREAYEREMRRRHLHVTEDQIRSHVRSFLMGTGRI
jgi:hypothetical protein